MVLFKFRRTISFIGINLYPQMPLCIKHIEFTLFCLFFVNPIFSPISCKIHPYSLCSKKITTNPINIYPTPKLKILQNTNSSNGLPKHSVLPHGIFTLRNTGFYFAMCMSYPRFQNNSTKISTNFLLGFFPFNIFYTKCFRSSKTQGHNKNICTIYF